MKIGAIGIRTKIIVGDAATWYLVKKYIDGKLGGGIDDVPEELKKYVRVLGSWVDVTEDLAFIENKVDKVEGSLLVPDTEIDKLAEYPELLEETTNKVISDTGELISIPIHAGGYANNLYFGETDSDVAGYKILTYMVDAAEAVKTVTARESDGVVTAQTFLYPTGVSVSNFPSGLWSLKLWGNISAQAGISQVGFTYFKRSTLGVETDLFTLWSEEVNNTSDTWIDVIGTQPLYSVDPTDRMGLRLLFKTTSGTNKTLTYSIGDGYAAFVNNPNQIRHSQTRDKNGEELFQHVDTTSTKETLAEADKVALYDSVMGKVVLTPKSNLETDLTAVNLEITNLQNNKADKAQCEAVEGAILDLQTNSEIKSNKTSDIEANKTSVDKYPNVKGVVDYVASSQTEINLMIKYFEDFVSLDDGEMVITDDNNLIINI